MEYSSDKFLYLYSEILCSNLRRDIGYYDFCFCAVIQSLEAEVGILLELGHGRFLPHTSEFTLHVLP
jgi:hypothetical protein